MLFKIFIFWRISLFFLTYLGSGIFPLVSNNGFGAIGPMKNFDYLWSWAQWDGGYYLSIAQNGYKSLENFAFFPLYPILISLLGKVIGNHLIAGLVISNLSFIGFLYVFYSFVKDFFSKEIARISTLNILFFPTAFFGAALYSESLFLLLSASAFYLMYKKKWILASIFTGFASLTRVFGIFISISLAYSYFAGKKKKMDINVISIFVPFLIFSFFVIYQKIAAGSAFMFLNIQTLWQRSFTDPLSTIASSFISILRGGKPVIDYFDLMVTVIFFTALILGRRKIPSSLWIYSLLVLLFPASTGTLSSMPRYLLSSIGSFIIFAYYLNNRPLLRFTVWGVCLGFQVFLAVRFINGYWAS